MELVLLNLERTRDANARLVGSIYPKNSSEHRRITRVLILILSLGLLNLYDLEMTIKAMQMGLMFEANPVADFVIRQHGVLGVSLFKTFSVGSAIVLFGICRRFASAEWACFAAVVIYAAVCYAWLQYPIDDLAAVQLGHRLEVERFGVFDR